MNRILIKQSVGVVLGILLSGGLYAQNGSMGATGSSGASGTSGTSGTTPGTVGNTNTAPTTNSPSYDVNGNLRTDTPNGETNSTLKNSSNGRRHKRRANTSTIPHTNNNVHRTPQNSTQQGTGVETIEPSATPGGSGRSENSVPANQTAPGMPGSTPGSTSGGGVGR